MLCFVPQKNGLGLGLKRNTCKKKNKNNKKPMEKAVLLLLWICSSVVCYGDVVVYNNGLNSALFRDVSTADLNHKNLENHVPVYFGKQFD